MDYFYGKVADLDLDHSSVSGENDIIRITGRCKIDNRNAEIILFRLCSAGLSNFLDMSSSAHRNLIRLSRFICQLKKEKKVPKQLLVLTRKQKLKKKKNKYCRIVYNKKKKKRMCELNNLYFKHTYSGPSFMACTGNKFSSVPSRSTICNTLCIPTDFRIMPSTCARYVLSLRLASVCTYGKNNAQKN